MEDREIIKAFEYCPQTRACTHAECPLFGSGETVAECAAELNEKVRDLIQRQQERIERIVEQLEQQAKQYERRGTEAMGNGLKVPLSEKFFGKAWSYDYAIEIVKGVQND